MGVFTLILGDIEGAGITLWPKKLKEKVTLKTVNSIKHRIFLILLLFYELFCIDQSKVAKLTPEHLLSRCNVKEGTFLQ